ncbi:helix-turn-helix transcriptional regulator [Streptomyces sp. NPDC046939]|uniref:helix-turn-helix domain-containing protein n=1 Tax=Streptomyces sp. NPDC046939 TaxID=3155376 RepID=UPI0033D0EA03
MIAEHKDESGDGSGWDVEPDDEVKPVVAAVGRQLRAWREVAGLSAGQLGARLGYGEGLVYKVEQGTRIPRPEFLDKADEVLEGRGRIAAMKKDLEDARYPKKVRDLAKLERDSVEVLAYGDRTLHALLQTKEYATALFAMRRPRYSAEIIEREVAARIARQEILDNEVFPVFSFVQEEVTLRRPLGGREVHRRQLQQLLRLSRLPTVDIQVMPSDCAEHPGLDGAFRVLKQRGGTTLGHVEVQSFRQLITDPTQVQYLEMRYGMIRAQALPPRESLTFIEKVLNET